MITVLSGKDVAAKLQSQFPTAVLEANDSCLIVRSELVRDVISFLKSSPEFDLSFLNSVTSADYYDYFEVVYHLTSMAHTHTLCLKTRVYDRVKPTVPSITDLFKGADFQEREIYDLMGINFEGHPNMKRIFLWDGFNGHPLRKDWNGA